MKNGVQIYDTTLRDGTQSEGVSFSKTDKIRIAEKLDAFGIAYIEGGWPGSNPKDRDFFEEMKSRPLKQAKLTAFGSTCRVKGRVEDDKNLQLLVEAETPVITIFGKSWLLHVHDVLKTTPERNLEIVGDSVGYLAGYGREVIFDAEHFFDGYVDSPEYALDVLRRSAEAGASSVVLCDTNGGMLPHDIARITEVVRAALPEDVVVGIHCHNDTECAVASSLAAIRAGATHVQGTVNGIGERCGNANLCSIIPALEMKMDLRCLQDADALTRLCELSRFVDDHANMRGDDHRPYVGQSAFAHKGGMHVNAVSKNATTFEHVKPESVGNRRRILISDLSGGSNILLKAEEHDIDLNGKGDDVRQILVELKNLEAEGYEFESADASFSLLVEKLMHKHQPLFHLEGFRVIVEKRGPEDPSLSEATIKLRVNDQTELMAAEGTGPVHALDLALRKALIRFFPEVADMHLRDYKVRILDGEGGTAVKTRVLIESGDGKDIWSTVGVSENIIEASWEALVDSVEYFLIRKRHHPNGV